MIIKVDVPDYVASGIEDFVNGSDNEIQPPEGWDFIIKADGVEIPFPPPFKMAKILNVKEPKRYRGTRIVTVTVEVRDTAKIAKRSSVPGQRWSHTDTLYFGKPALLKLAKGLNIFWDRNEG